MIKPIKVPTLNKLIKVLLSVSPGNIRNSNNKTVPTPIKNGSSVSHENDFLKISFIFFLLIKYKQFFLKKVVRTGLEPV